MKLKTGQQAPAFSLFDQAGKNHKLSDYKGKWLLLYFYPRDNTPGCTKEACMIRDNYSGFKKMKATVIGVSADTVASHSKFAAKHELPFPLLADESQEVVKKYDVWGPKKFMGREFLGIKRTSFLIGPTGKIAKIYEKVKPNIHAEEVIQDLMKIK